MDENRIGQTGIGRKALNQNPLDENWAHGVSLVSRILNL